MTKVINDPSDFKEDMIAGMVRAYRRYFQRVPNATGVMVPSAPRAGKVSVINGGGSGHYPVFAGLVGQGMMDAAVIGDVFTSPSNEQAYRVAKAVASDAGVLFSYGYYNGDVMNFDMASMRLEDDGIHVETVLVTDDVASAPPTEHHERRGIAGGFFVYKALGASSARGDNLATVKAMGEHANAHTRTFGVAFDGCTLPGKSEPLFTVDAGKMELGLGIHGEPGIEVGDIATAQELAKIMSTRVLADPPDGASSDVAVIVNSLGRTSDEELFVLYKDVAGELEQAGLNVHETHVGRLTTSLDMDGCSLSLFWLDDELKPLLEAPADCPAYTRIGS
ncbi:MAG: dihydroxyacetone kinase subunit DhaK [Deinococcota bacterium]